MNQISSLGELQAKIGMSFSAGTIVQAQPIQAEDGDNPSHRQQENEERLESSFPERC
jgi:hypothetical protein